VSFRIFRCRLTPEARQLWITRDAYEQPDGDPRRECQTLTNTRPVVGRDDMFAEVVVRGVFKKNIIPADTVDLGACNDLGISLLSIGLQR
jgi:hypothetical protein